MDWIEILKSLLYDGRLTYGITLWVIIVFLIAIALIVMSLSAFRSAFGVRQLARMFLAKFNFGMRVRFPIYGDASDEQVANAIKEGIISGVGEFDADVGDGE